jgi:hypothetical protein
MSFNAGSINHNAISAQVCSQRKPFPAGFVLRILHYEGQIFQYQRHPCFRNLGYFFIIRFLDRGKCRTHHYRPSSFPCGGFGGLFKDTGTVYIPAFLEIFQELSRFVFVIHSSILFKKMSRRHCLV